MASAKSNSKPSSRSTSKKKYASKFIQAWVGDLHWISRSDRGLSNAYCRVCNSHFSVAAGGKYNAIRHATTSQHQQLERASRSNPVTSFFVNAKDQEITRRVIVAETLFANMVAEHNLSFSLADHFTKVVKRMFPDSETVKKFLCGRQKTTMIVRSAIAPERNKAVIEHCKTSRFSLMTDESNDSSAAKNLVILVRYFDNDAGKAVTRFLDMPTCNIGTGELIFDTISESLG